MLQTLKLSLGDYGAIDSSVYLDTENNWMFWIHWLIQVVVTSIVFLNFIIAEASASYEKVDEQLDSYIVREQAALIAEAENMRPNFLKNN